ncbi:cation diffusion facilitator family transporter [Thiohalorhabdus sp. Cl-TMA]|uniref:Cation diffusion facilitator family transporter n=1 Tax=Thiohalorhabdus methylotrophus TaxID=3242694 RepID=A0ABV4TUY5_9GAMM
MTEAPETGPGSAATDPERTEAAQKVTLIGAVTNLVLAAVKTVIGVLASSQALIADGLHSLSDLLTDALVLAAVRMGAREPDADHPYGHGRFETLATVLLGLILIGAGLGIAINAAVRLAAGEVPLPTWPALVAALFSIGANEWLYRIQVRIGRRYQATTVVANAWHHRTDALSSVAALAGIAGSMMGWAVLDTVAAVAVAFMVVWAGGKLGWDAIKELVDTALDQQEVEQIRRLMLRVEGVKSVHNLKTRRMGPEVLVDVHVQVPGTVSVSEGHQIAERVRKHVIQQHPEVSEVLVHVDPENDEQGAPLLPNRDQIMAEVRRRIEARAHPLAIRDHTVHYLDGRVTLELAVEVDPNRTLAEAYEIAERLRREICAETEVHEVQVTLFVPHGESGKAPLSGA